MRRAEVVVAERKTRLDRDGLPEAAFRISPAMLGKIDEPKIIVRDGLVGIEPKGLQKVALGLRQPSGLPQKIGKMKMRTGGSRFRCDRAAQELFARL